MSSESRVLIESQYLPTSAGVAYTSPVGGKGSYIDDFPVVNSNGGGAVTFNVWLVPNGGSAGGDNLFVKARSLAVGASDALPEVVGAFLAPGASIQWQASAGTSLAGRASGRELT